MINGKRHVLLPGEHLVVPPGLYRTFGNSTAEVGHAIAAFRPAMNIHQLFFEAFRTSRGAEATGGVAKVLHRYPDTSSSASRCSYTSLLWLGYRCPANSTDMPPSWWAVGQIQPCKPPCNLTYAASGQPVAVRRLPCKPTGLRALGLCQMRNPVGPYAAISDGRDPNCRCFAAPRLGGCWQSDQGERHAGLAVLPVSHVLRTSGLCHCWRTSQERRFGRRAAGVLGALRSEWV